MQKVTGIGVFSLAKFQGFFGAIMGFLIGLFYAAIALLITTLGVGMAGADGGGMAGPDGGGLMQLAGADGGGMAGPDGGGLMQLAGWGVTGAFVMIILLPILFGLSQFIFSLFFGAIMNVALKKAGGVKLRIE